MSSEGKFIYGERYRYDVDKDVIIVGEHAHDTCIKIAHELGHRHGVKSGRIPRVLRTKQDEDDAEIYAWRYAARCMRRKGIWDEHAKEVAKKSLNSHGIYWDNYMKTDALVNSF